MILNLKQELLEKIASTDDESLLEHIKKEIDYFTGAGETYFLNELSKTDREELQELLKEPFRHETKTYADFKKATERWRTK